MPVKNPEKEIKPGMVIGKLTVLSQSDSGRSGSPQWLVKCECGQELIASENSLKTHNIRACGLCDGDDSGDDSLVGQKFGMLTVTARALNDPYGKKRWNTVCDCGNQKVVREQYLKTFKIPNCGCYSKELQTTNLTHGFNSHPLAAIWRSMRNRCENPNNDHYNLYGGRGIFVCDRWQSLENFISDMEEGYKPGLQIDRIDNDGPYSPDNCRWVTREENGRNKRNNRNITTVIGKKPLVEQSEISGVPPATIRDRIEKGMPEPLSIIPVKKGQKLHAEELGELYKGEIAIWLDDKTEKEIEDIIETANIQADAINEWGFGPNEIILKE